VTQGVAHSADNQVDVGRYGRLERYIGKPLARNPLALASLYKDGLGRHWKNQTEAAESLSRFGENGNTSIGQCALRQCL
jgi:hypothetical protein